MRIFAVHRTYQTALIAAVVLAVFPARVFAAPSTTGAEPTRQQLSPSSQTDRAARRRSADIFSAPEAEACTLPDDPALKFTLRDVVVEGASQLPDSVVKASYSAMNGTAVTPAALCQIRDRIADWLFHRGILARVLIPGQKIADGRVRLVVIEAEIISVQVHGDVGSAQALVEAYLNHLRGMAPFDLNTAQRYLLLANDIPGVRADARLVHSSSPGAPAGGLDLDVTLDRKAYDEVAEVDNTSSKTLGPVSGVARVDFNSFTRLGERTTLIGYTTLGNDSQSVVEVLEQFHLGDQGLYAQGSLAYGRSYPTGVLKPLNLRGDSLVGTIELDDPVIRLKREGLTLSAGFDSIDQRTDFAAGGTLTNDNLRVAWLKSDGNVQRQFYPESGFGLTGVDGDITLEARKGLRGLGASVAGSPDLSRPAGRSDAWVLRTGAHAAIHLDLADGLALVASANFAAQWADRPLLAYEEQAIGNMTIGQGYDPAAATGDRAIAAEFKVATGPFQVAPRTAFRPYVFYDTAHVVSLEPGTADVNLRSVGFGVELRLPYNIKADVDFAQPLDKTSPAAAAVGAPRVLFRLVIAH